MKCNGSKWIVFLVQPQHMPIVLLIILCSAPLKSWAQTFNSDVQQNVETLQNYYQKVQQQMHRRNSAAPGSEPASTRSVPDMPTRLPSAINEAQLSAPISGQAQTTATAYSAAGRDPFAVTPIMLENENFSLKQKIEFTPLQGNFKLPNMRLKGVISGQSKNSPLAALLEIDGLGVFVVREGDNVGLQGIGNGHDIILIESISRLSMVVRTGSLGGVSEQRFVVR